MTETLFGEHDLLTQDDDASGDVLTATASDLLRLLRQRYRVHVGNGPRYVHAAEVRNRAGFDATRACDFIAIDTWPSKGLAIHGHEVKVSRGDWLRELKAPEKAEAFARYCDYWWIVAPSKVVRLEELPSRWGLLVPSNDRLRVCRPAWKNPTVEPMPRTMWVTFARAAASQARRFNVDGLYVEQIRPVPVGVGP